MYTIKTIAELTGLGPETLRAWERRYRAVVPRRDDSGRRLYSQQELDRLIALANLTRQGHAISKLVQLDSCQLFKLLKTMGEETGERNLFAEQILDALQEYRVDRCEKLLKKALVANDSLPYVRDVLAPALRDIGRLWHDGKLTVAQEHLFSACVRRILLATVNGLQGLPGNNDRPVMVFATPKGEFHEFGLLMCVLLASEQHCDCYYLGADVPALDLALATEKLGADILVLGLSNVPPNSVTLQELNQIVQALGEENKRLWLGGEGAQYWKDQQAILPEHCEVLTDFDQFYARTWHYRERR